jgi:hypothetical protein
MRHLDENICSLLNSEYLVTFFPFVKEHYYDFVSLPLSGESFSLIRLIH